MLEFTSPPDYEAADGRRHQQQRIHGDGDQPWLTAPTTGTVSVTVSVTDMDEEIPPTNGNGNGGFDPLSYDGVDKGGNVNGAIDRPEVITAIRDYFDDQITRDNVIAVIRLYFGNGS